MAVCFLELLWSSFGETLLITAANLFLQPIAAMNTLELVVVEEAEVLATKIDLALYPGTTDPEVVVAEMVRSKASSPTPPIRNGRLNLLTQLRSSKRHMAIQSRRHPERFGRGQRTTNVDSLILRSWQKPSSFIAAGQRT